MGAHKTHMRVCALVWAHAHAYIRAQVLYCLLACNQCTWHASSRFSSQNTMYELSLAEAHMKRFSEDEAGGGREDGPQDDPDMVRGGREGLGVQ